MARGKTARGRRGGQRTTQQHHDPALLAAQKEAERREQIIADTRRTAAKWRPKIPEVRRCNFENYKNRFHGLDEKDYAIDVLVRGPTLEGQIRREQAKRRREELARIRQSYMLAYGGLKEEPRPYIQHSTRDSDEKARKEKKADVLQTNDTEIHRVRIQSQPVLGHLTSLLNETEQRSTPRTFLRPFKALVYYQPKMKEILATLEEKWADVEDLDESSSSEKRGDETPEEVEFVEAEDSKESAAEGQPKDDSEGGDVDIDDAASIVSVDSNAEDLDTINMFWELLYARAPATDSKDMSSELRSFLNKKLLTPEVEVDSVEALRDMRCYVNFVDNDIMPMYKQYDGTTAERVKYDDLWSLFRVGDLICMPAAGETAGRYHEIWRIYRIELPKAEASTRRRPSTSSPTTSTTTATTSAPSGTPSTSRRSRASG
ncbi:hypothetical protein NPX13_g10965 [Xylaria arbuscula]|uniref:Uncharacterized protein n=1 Tax=Xylaria arbuscula TaxID=114810 RepID=A0A9W8N3Q0_9PEZI|nr:hypothetical protein NPX13_g10965 [Xylaria arbuscula]